METPGSLKYTESHEWVRIEAGKAYVGITDYAQETLGDIVYVELPAVGRKTSMGEELSTIESVKAAEPLYGPITGTIVEVNESVNDKPEAINEKPYENHLFVIEIADPSEIEKLLDAEAYQKIVDEEKNE